MCSDRPVRRVVSVLATVILAGGLSAWFPGCAPGGPTGEVTYRTLVNGPERDTDAARRHNALGVASLDAHDLLGAEAEFKAALAADENFGPAHNNLGVVYMRGKKFYLAAVEFNYAAKMMSDRVQPLHNLGLVRELTGRFDQAEGHYEEALKVRPDSGEIAASLARLHMRMGRRDERTRALLRIVVANDTRPRWVRWAEEKLMLMRPTPATRPAGRDDVREEYIREASRVP